MNGTGSSECSPRAPQGWGDLYGHVVPGRTVRAGAWHACIRVGVRQHPPETQPVASQASTDDGQRVDFIRRQEWERAGMDAAL